MAEDRERFDALLERFSIKRPQGRAITGMQEALDAAHELGYPVLLRPSYVIGGQNMVIAHNDEDVRTYMVIHNFIFYRRNFARKKAGIHISILQLIPCICRTF